MALNLRERFGPKEPDSRRLLAQDFEFSPANYPALKDFIVERDDLEFLEKPLAVARNYVITHGMEGVQLELALCLAGPQAAFDLLFHRASSFQREPDEQRVSDISRGLNIGDAGVGWQWSDRERDGVLGFVRHNVLAFMKGRYERMLVFARELDAHLARLETRSEYPDSARPLFEVATRAGGLATTAGARLDLGSQPADAQSFFIATGGAVNRDAADPSRFYYRAGLAKGAYSIVAYRVGKGLLPERQTMPVRIA